MATQKLHKIECYEHSQRIISAKMSKQWFINAIFKVKK